MRPNSRFFAAAVIVLALLSAGPARALPPGYTLEQVVSNVNFPGQIRFAPDGRLFYLEVKTGRVMVASPPYQSWSVWATLPIDTFGERGLLGMAFHPSYADSHFVYIYYTNLTPLTNRIVRFLDLGTIGTAGIVFFDGIPAYGTFHHGGRLAFGPDRMLYATHGEQTEMADAQDQNSLNGKILRLTPGGKAAPDNPYGPTNPAALKGVRNPFGICFDPRDGTGYFTENGPDCDDEVNLIVLGANYGWGTADFCGGQPSGSYPAIKTFTPTIAPTGCTVYRGTRYTPVLDGDLFFGSYNYGVLEHIKFVPGTVDQIALYEEFATFPEPLLDVTTGIDGYLWVATTSTIWRILPPNVAGVDLPVARPSLSAAPNPFTRGVELTLGGAGSFDRLEVLDLAGRRVRSFSVQGSSTILWDGHDDQGEEVRAGVYLVRIHGASNTITRRVVKLAR